MSKLDNVQKFGGKNMFQLIDEIIKGKKILILGFGREGKSTFAVLEKVKSYSVLAIADKVNLDRVSLGIPEYVELVTGEDYQTCLNDFDVVFKSPGIVLEKDISTYTCEIVSQTEIFFRRYRDQIIGITGTKGKSTTTTLLYHILKTAGFDTILAGNIGIPVFDNVEQITENTKLVVELSCHQLEYMTVSPKTGVLVNIHEEHLDHYGTMEKYVAAKENIYRNQKQGDILFCHNEILPVEGTCKANVYGAYYPVSTKEKMVIGKESAVALTGKVGVVNGEVRFGEERYMIPTDEIQLMGDHNYYDIAIVFAICMQQGVSVEDFDKGLKTYEILPHRLHYIATKNGVKYYDDSISTICDTTIQALNTLKNADTVLIGGMDRGIDYTDLITYLSSCSVPNIILMEATGKRILKEIKEQYPKFQNTERLLLVEHLEDAVELASKVTRAGHSCVLSPAAASYGIFKNFEHRGERFKELILSL